jgi:hypothetical protein
MEYQYDLAISLLDEDAQLAWEIINKLDNPDKIFFYKKDADELTFRNGINVFGDVFSLKARFILVLHRERYGTTDWTALEYSIIQDRFKQTIKTGDSPILFCKLDSSPKPSWLPDNYIYSSGEDIDSLVKLIRKRIIDQGGISFPKTTENKLKIHVAKKKYEESFLNKSFHSIELAEEAREEAELLREKLFEKLKRNATENNLYFSDKSTVKSSIVPIASLKVMFDDLIVTLLDEQESTNSIFAARLKINIFKEIRDNSKFDSTFEQIKKYEKCYYITADNIKGWRDVNQKNFLSTDGLVETVFQDVYKCMFG